MGICLYNKEYEMDMGYFTFAQLRTIIAKLLNKEFGENYSLLRKCIAEKDFKENDKIANSLIAKYNLDEDVVGFLYQSDCSGKITYKTCRKIYKLIKDYDDNFMYGYVHSNHSFSYFKEMIKNCADKRRMLFWN